MKVVVFGPVDYYNNEVVKQAIEECGWVIDEIYTTDDPGVAAATRVICEFKNIKCRVLAPDWNNLNAPKAEIRTKNGQKYNHRAGYDRNKSLIELGDAFILIFVGKPSEAMKKISDLIDADKTKSVSRIFVPG